MGAVMSVWIGANPKSCDICPTEITNVFYDARTTIRGAWACMCPACYAQYGLGALGPGRGQRYELQEDGKFLKTEG